MPTGLQYERIKTFIVNGIDTGQWEIGARLPSENQLAEKFAISRMTVNRAIKELEAGGVVERVQGKGTFVAPPKPLLSVLQIQGIDDEIRERGNRYSCKLLRLKSVYANDELSHRMEVPKNSELWHSSIVHFENEVPVQLEQRWVRPSVAKHYLQQDFEARTPHEYLMSLAPFTRGEHIIEACIASARIRKPLQMSAGEPCLLIHRCTWVRRTLASYVKLFHPGNRFQLTAQLSR